ncbi:MAG: lysozyme inhibitor LprI family protein [Telluria sp.]
MPLQYPFRRIGVLFTSLAFVSLGEAASFDCAKAHLPFERAVCADPKVSAADTLLAQRYSKAMSQLSDAGKHIVQDGQRQWLRYVRILCTGHTNDATRCLKDAYDARLNDLKLAAVRVGPYVFSRIDFYAAADPDEHGVLSKGQIAVPRIDSPITSLTMEWNKVMARIYASRPHSAGCDGPSGDYAFDYKIGGVTRTSISIVTNDWMYCHGAAHGYGSSKSITYVTQPELHPLAATDLFRSDINWTAFLVKRCALKIQEDSGTTSLDPKAIVEAVRAPESWAVSSEGLVITIDTLEVGAGPGIVKVAFSWADLQPFLTAAATSMF